MNTMKALFRSLLVMLFLWMISLLVYYWPLPDEVLPRESAEIYNEVVKELEAEHRVRVLPID